MGKNRKKFFMSAVQYLAPLCTSDIVLLMWIFESGTLATGNQTSW